MGAWGGKTFENDIAMDFIGDLAEAPVDAAETVRSALEEAAGTAAGEYLDADVGSEALAAAAVVSAALPGSPVDRSDPSVDEYLTAIVPHVPAGLASAAVAAIDRVLGPESELVELWAQAESLEAFRAEPAAVRAHLVSS